MYKSHIKTKKDFFCSLCNNKAFKQAFNFQLHMLIHLEEQPEKCRFCSKAFRTKPSLRKHELIHTGLKLFSCPQCNSRFKTKDELKQHKISHTTGMKNISLIKRVSMSFTLHCAYYLKVAFFQKVLMHLSYHQTHDDQTFEL